MVNAPRGSARGVGGSQGHRSDPNTEDKLLPTRETPASALLRASLFHGRRLLQAVGQEVDAGVGVG